MIFLLSRLSIKDPLKLFLTLISLTRTILFLALLSLPLSLILSLQSPEEVLQGQSVLYLYLHVPAALSCFLLYGIMSCGALLNLIWRLKHAYFLSMACLSPCLLMAAITLCTGCLWGLSTWGTYWIWDARLTSFLFLTLFLMMLFILKQHPRFQNSHRSRQVLSVLILVGLIDVIFVHQSVVWFKTLHQPPSFRWDSAPTMDSEFLVPLSLSTLSFFASSLGLSMKNWLDSLLPLFNHKRGSE